MSDDDSHDLDALDRVAQQRARELRTVIEFGMAVEALIAGPIGQRLIHDSEEERRGLTEDLVRLDPDVDAERAQMRAIRLRVGVLDHWQQLLVRYVEEGTAAEVAFREGEITGD